MAQPTNLRMADRLFEYLTSATENEAAADHLKLLPRDGVFNETI